MKQPKAQRQVCMMCGKPSKETICEVCKTKVQGELLHKKLETEKKG